MKDGQIIIISRINFKNLQKVYLLEIIMASVGHYLVDQQTEVANNYLIGKVQNNNQSNINEISQIIQERNQLIDSARSKGSYQVVLEQSLTTQDKPFLYEILVENDPLIIRSSLQSLSPKKIVQLLRMIRSLLQQHIKLGKGEDHCLSISFWLQELIRLHLSTIVSNIENKQTILAIRKFIQKKTQPKQQLHSIRSHLLSQQSATELQNLNSQGRQRKNPKFEYIEQEKQHIEQQQQAEPDSQEINDEDMDGLQLDDLELDQLMDDF